MPEREDRQTAARLLRIHGKVQGVWYRASAQTEATRLGLCGWVRNRLDGSVEALVIGPLPAVETFVAWAHQGPPQARVTRIDISIAKDEITDGFEQRPTA
ncbi:acylphosphatase [Thauera sp.]|uniref:acylphosphatase n=1 Tax=Thauera sp. TaxID=1905334 RepID=UPI0039E32DBD